MRTHQTANTYPKEDYYRRLVQAKLYIDEHYTQKTDLDAIAEAASFSKFHFIRMFKASYHKTPHQYLVSLRMARARNLLESGKSVSEVCFGVGFESLSSFSGLFKKTFGISPAAYAGQRQTLRLLQRQSPLSYVPGCFAEKSGWLNK
jgi:AraC-like DNA-binding protein